MKSKKDYYVYQLIDPRNDEVFYVGKGSGNRINQHEHAAKRFDSSNSRKTQRILDILKDGETVTKFIYAKNLLEQDAFDLERELIKEIGREKLTNYHSGVKTDKEHARLLFQRIKPIRKWAADRLLSGQGYTIQDLHRYRELVRLIKGIANGQKRSASNQN